MPLVTENSLDARRFQIVRQVTSRSRRINCGFCGCRINPSFRYNIYENNEIINSYPFHTLRCAEAGILPMFGYADFPYTIEYVNEDVSEETTE